MEGMYKLGIFPMQVQIKESTSSAATENGISFDQFDSL